MHRGDGSGMGKLVLNFNKFLYRPALQDGQLFCVCTLEDNLT